MASRPGRIPGGRPASSGRRLRLRRRTISPKPLSSRVDLMTATTRSPSATPPSEVAAENTLFGRRPLEHQFENLEQQHEVAALGMWIFLATEVMFFGALFVGLATYGSVYPVSFAKASERLQWQIGAINTVVLLCSSFTMVMAVHHARLGRRRSVAGYLIGTALLGTLFLAF